jgi:hypothetical protein
MQFVVRGAIGGLAGDDVAVLSICEHSKVDVSVLSDTTVLDLTLAQVAGVLTKKMVNKSLQSSTSVPAWERGDP